MKNQNLLASIKEQQDTEELSGVVPGKTRAERSFSG